MGSGLAVKDRMCGGAQGVDVGCEVGCVVMVAVGVGWGVSVGSEVGCGVRVGVTLDVVRVGGVAGLVNCAARWTLSAARAVIVA
jgi:hypothetical protein